MGDQTQNKRNRNTALFLIGTGIFLLLERQLGLFFVLALMLLIYGIYLTRVDHSRKGMVLIGVSALVLVIQHISVVIALALCLGGYYYYQSQKANRSSFRHKKHTLADSIRWGRDPWVLRDSSVWFVFGEVNMDLSMAIMEQEETTILLQGVIGDVKIMIPEEIGVCVEASLALGPLDVHLQQERGVLNKVQWCSPNYDTSNNRVKLIIAFILGDVDVKIIS